MTSDLSKGPILYWIRRDFRLADHPGLAAASASGRPVIPVFLWDEVAEATGACPAWRLGLGAEAFGRALKEIGSALVFRRGQALSCLEALIAETGATSVWWSRAYDPDAIARDTGVKSALKAAGIDAQSFPGHLLFEPWSVQTGSGGPYRVYSPFWRAVRGVDVGASAPTVDGLRPPDRWPASDDPADWNLPKPMNRGASIVRPHLAIGEDAARLRLDRFADEAIGSYKSRRDFPGEPATSRLSENLTYGEISPRACWQAGMRALEAGVHEAEHFLREVAWREFAYHLAFHTPHITTESWRSEWQNFPWSEDAEAPEVRAWKQGRTGVEFVDAAMREMYVTGTMHNRARMIVASYLTKHLMTHWKIGADWFADCLVDWDPASNAMGWQWAAGSGPDAAPYFRVFNAETQAEKFDPDRTYRSRWIAEGQGEPGPDAQSFFRAIPRSWGLGPGAAYPAPVVSMPDGRARALRAYEEFKTKAG